VEIGVEGEVTTLQIIPWIPIGEQMGNRRQEGANMDVEEDV